jgi:hypothetical protein
LRDTSRVLSLSLIGENIAMSMVKDEARQLETILNLRTVIRRCELGKYLGVKDTAIQKLLDNPDSGFPAGFRLTPDGRARGWLLGSIIAYQEKRIALAASGEDRPKYWPQTPNCKRKREREAAAAAASGPSPVPAVAPPLSKRAAAAGRKAAVAARRSAKKSTRV